MKSLPIAVPTVLNRPIVNVAGDSWYVLSTGVTREDGKTMAHLSSTTRGWQKKNGVHPVQMMDYIDLPNTDRLSRK